MGLKRRTDYIQGKLRKVNAVVQENNRMRIPHGDRVEKIFFAIHMNGAGEDGIRKKGAQLRIPCDRRSLSARIDIFFRAQVRFRKF